MDSAKRTRGDGSNIMKPNIKVKIVIKSKAGISLLILLK